jgi:uncharacterized protein (DUF488 family)
VATLYTIGHSTRTLDDFLAALKAHGIVTLVDIRAFPVSRRLPHFNRESLEAELPRAGIAYVWKKKLGGRRKKVRDDSPHVALRSPSFRNYADHMLTPEFQQAAADILALAEQRRPAVMCAEKLYFNCHRMLVSDYFVSHGHEVLHIEDAARTPRPHQLTAEARMKDGELLYIGDRLF